MDLAILSIKKPMDVEKIFIPLLLEHGTTYSKYQTSLSYWIKSRAVNLEPQNQSTVRDTLANIQMAREKYISAIDKVANHRDTITQAKTYYAALNEQRNSVNKELNKASDIVLKDLKASTFCTTKHEDCKDLVRILKDYSNAKKEFNI